MSTTDLTEHDPVRSIGSPSLPPRYVRDTAVGRVLRRWAVALPDGTLEVCPFCRSHSGQPKIVFEDRYDADSAAAELEVLPGAYARVRVHRCSLWRGIWHVTGGPVWQ